MRWLWGARFLLLFLLLLAFLGPSWPGRGRVVYLLDFSPSAREGVWALASRLPRGGVYVAFAEEAATLPAPTARRLLGEKTQLEAAYREALRHRPDRVVLVSDGLLEPVPPPFPLDAVYVPPSPGVELRLLPPPYPLLGETVAVGVLLEAPRPLDLVLRVEGPGGVREEAFRLEGRWVLPYTFPLEGEAEVRAQVFAQGIPPREARLRLAPADRLRALVLGDRALARYLEAQGFAVEEDPFRLPLDHDLVAVGLGVLDLPPGAAEALRGYLRGGGGLLFTATPKGLFLGGWDRALPEDLPLKPVGRKGAALVLVLDVSGSMEGEKLRLAIQGALELVRSTGEEDYLGVVLFSSAPRVLFPPRPMTPQGKREAESLLLSVRAGGGTVLGPAFRQALELLEPLPLERKGILVLSDGVIADPPGPILGLARSAGVQVSTLALGEDADEGFLRELAQAGGGRFYLAREARELPRLLLEEGQEVFRTEGVLGRFPVSPRPHPLTRGLAFPPVDLLLPARAEDWAVPLLEAGEGVLLALGERGEGRVAALATDLAYSWRDWPQAAPFLGGLARYLAGARRALALYAYPEGEGVRVVVLGRLEDPRALVEGREIPLVPTGPGRFEAVLPGEGVLLDGPRRLPLVLPLPGEWSYRDGRAVLEALARVGGGRVLSLEALSGLPPKPLPLSPYLLLLALGLFLLERFLEFRLRSLPESGPKPPPPGP